MPYRLEIKRNGKVVFNRDNHNRVNIMAWIIEYIHRDRIKDVDTTINIMKVK